MSEHMAAANNKDTLAALRQVITQVIAEASLASLPEVVSALDKCDMVEMDESLAQGLVDYGGVLLGLLVQQTKSDEESNLQFGGNIANISSLCDRIMKRQEVQNLNKSIYAVEVVDLSQSVMGFKTALKGVSPQVDGEAIDMELLYPSASEMVAAHRNILKQTEPEVPDGAGNWRSMCDYAKMVLSETKETFEKCVAQLKKEVLKDIAAKKSSLDRVAGGLDDGRKWKEHVMGAKTMSEMVDALAVLQKLYAVAMAKRKMALKTARCRVLEWVRFRPSPSECDLSHAR